MCLFVFLWKVVSTFQIHSHKKCLQKSEGKTDRQMKIIGIFTQKSKFGNTISLNLIILHECVLNINLILT